MKNLYLLIVTFIFTSCQISENSSVSSANIGTLPSASDICSGKTILDVAGTADCSGGGSVSATEVFYVFAARADAPVLDFNALVDDLWAGTDPVATREVATLKDAKEGSLLYTNNYSVIPRPLYDSDGRYAMSDWSGTPIAPAIPAKRHYLETIALNKTAIARGAIQVCGTSGTISARIADCRSENGAWSFYSGAQYGQLGEGDWSLVTVVDDSGTNREVWRDERTKLLWSDKAVSDYNWYRASGYSKLTADSIAETEFSSEPGVQITTPFDPVANGWGWTISQATMQPAVVDGGPISVCPDVIGGQIAAGGGTLTTYAPNPETKFKGSLSIADNVIWKLPSIDDYKLADVNGIRKVLPNMDFNFWSSSSDSDSRYYAWGFYGGTGSMGNDSRVYTSSVRCVASSRD